MATESDGPVTLPVHCGHCGRPVKMQYVPDGSQWPTQHVWICPYAECGQMDVASLYGGPPVVTTDVFRRDGPGI